MQKEDQPGSCRRRKRRRRPPAGPRRYKAAVQGRILSERRASTPTASNTKPDAAHFLPGRAGRAISPRPTARKPRPWPTTATHASPSIGHRPHFEANGISTQRGYSGKVRAAPVSSPTACPTCLTRWNRREPAVRPALRRPDRRGHVFHNGWIAACSASQLSERPFARTSRLLVRPYDAPKSSAGPAFQFRSSPPVPARRTTLPHRAGRHRARARKRHRSRSRALQPAFCSNGVWNVRRLQCAARRSQRSRAE